MLSIKTLKDKFEHLLDVVWWSTKSTDNFQQDYQSLETLSIHGDFGVRVVFVLPELLWAAVVFVAFGVEAL